MASRKWDLLESRKVSRTLTSGVWGERGIGRILQVKEKLFQLSYFLRPRLAQSSTLANKDSGKKKRNDGL